MQMRTLLLCTFAGEGQGWMSQRIRFWLWKSSDAESSPPMAGPFAKRGYAAACYKTSETSRLSPVFGFPPGFPRFSVVPGFLSRQIKALIAVAIKGLHSHVALLVHLSIKLQVTLCDFSLVAKILFSG